MAPPSVDAAHSDVHQWLRALAELCELPKDPGPCSAYVPSWHYNSKKDKCVKFIYGGCEGNANRFDMESICETRCSKKGLSRVWLPRLW